MALKIETKRIEPDALHMREGWLTGSDGETKFAFDRILGGRTLILTVTLPDGETIKETMDAFDLVTAWVNAIVEGANGRGCHISTEEDDDG